jgi:single-strand DNA-binding protein
MNKVILEGFTGKDPVSFADGKVVRASLGVGGGKDKKTEWFNLKCFKDVAKRMLEEVRKGSKLHVEGKLEMNEYTAKDGTKKSGVDIIVWEFEVLEKKKESSSTGFEVAGSHEAPHQVGAPSWTEDDIPF